MATKKTMNFEDSMRRLDEIVTALDSGSESLEQSMKLYEEGVALARSCAQTLEQAEQKVRVLSMRQDGTAVLRDAEGGEEDL